VILPDIAGRDLNSLKGKLRAGGFDFEPSWATRGLIACTGVQFCKLAIAETKNRARQLDQYLAEHVALDDYPRISVTGCPNSCGQHHICDVGLEGALLTVDGVKREVFQVFLGGGVGPREGFGRRIGVRIPSEELPEKLSRLFAWYSEHRRGAETFQEFCGRHSDDQLAALLKPQQESTLPSEPLPDPMSRHLLAGKVG
jgi:sulfite reductase beta subunit-like hemoprotein